MHDYNSRQMETGNQHTFSLASGYMLDEFFFLKKCRTLEEIEALADRLADSRNNHARRLATTIRHKIVPPLFAKELVLPLSFFKVSIQLVY